MRIPWLHHRKPEAIIPGNIKLPAQLTKRNRPATWLVSTAFVLVVFLVFLPSRIRTAFWHSLQSQAILVVMLLVFSLLALSLMWSAGQRLDIWVFQSFNTRGAHPNWLDQVMLGFTQAGNGFTSLAIALILVSFNANVLGYELILGTLSLWLVVELIKTLIHRQRPFIRLVQARVVGYRARGRSFPSGHTSQVFFMATFLSRHFHANLGVVLLIYAVALLVGITRLYVGAHYPRDVLAGAILGSAWGLIGTLVDGYVLNGT